MSNSKIDTDNITNEYSIQPIDINIFRTMKKDEKLTYLGLKKHPYAKTWDKKTLEVIFMEYQISNHSKKIKLILAYINELLESWGKERIEKLEDFKNIDKQYFLEERSDVIFKTYLDEFCAMFGKNQIRYSCSNKIPNYILTVTKKILELCGYKLDFTILIQFKNIDNKCKRFSKSVVTIVREE